MSDDSVGYGKPPKMHQWQPGQSGNKSGRPKRKPSLQEVVAKELARMIVVTENGKKTKISVRSAMVKQLFRKALSGDQSTLRQALQLAASCGAEELSRDVSEMFSDDQRLLDELQDRLRDSGSDGDTDPASEPLA